MLRSFLDHWLHSLTIARESSRQLLIKEVSKRVLRFFGITIEEYPLIKNKVKSIINYLRIFVLLEKIFPNLGFIFVKTEISP
jgi:hypothetical protein